MANKARQIEKLKKQFFPDKWRLTKNQKAWLEEYRKAQNRIDDWAEKFRAVYELPQKVPKSIKKEDIENLKNVNWRKFTEEQKQKAREQFEIYYEGEVPEVYKKHSKYVPPTETEWIEGYGPLDDIVERSEMYWDEKEDEDGYIPVVDSRAEIEKWIEKVIDTITLDREIPNVRETIISLVEDAARASDYSNDFYKYLEENSDRFNELAIKALHGYIKKSDGSTVYLEEGGENALPAFITLLNYGRAIDQYQSAEFTETGHITFDTTDL